MIKAVLAIITVLLSADINAEIMGNGCPNSDMVGKWNISVDWSCSGKDADTASWDLMSDGTARGGMKGNDGQMGSWSCVSGMKIVVQFPDMTFTSFNFSSTSMMGQVRDSAGREGCWISTHDTSTAPPINPRDAHIPRHQPPVVTNPPEQQRASPN